METPVRVMFASSEVAPFATFSEMGKVIRLLPEHLQETGSFESRIMMPRYGLISERRNRLHEVIRLSGAEIESGSRRETLKVKVASIPGIRLQVYFMDNPHFFKRKGVYQSTKQGLFSDNPERALFFARSVFQTSEKLGWAPGVIHAHGWIAGLIPVLLRTTYADHPLFADTKVVYSTDGFVSETPLSDTVLKQAGLNGADLPTEHAVEQLGYAFADATAYGDGLAAPTDDAIALNADSEDLTDRAITLYTQLVSERSVAA